MQGFEETQSIWICVSHAKQKHTACHLWPMTDLAAMSLQSCNFQAKALLAGVGTEQAESDTRLLGCGVS